MGNIYETLILKNHKDSYFQINMLCFRFVHNTMTAMVSHNQGSECNIGYEWGKP